MIDTNNQIVTFIIDAFFAMSSIELIAVIMSITYVVLAAKRNIWCWPAGFIASSLYVYLCIIGNLYIESILQTYYVLMAVVGWYFWTQSANQDKPIATLSLKKHVQLIASGVLLAIITGYIFLHFTDAAVPFLDAFTTIFSFIATWMVARKILENWVYWIVIDFACIFLYADRTYYLTSLLYIIYTLIAITGLVAWKKAYQTQLKSL